MPEHLKLPEQSSPETDKELFENFLKKFKEREMKNISKLRREGRNHEAKILEEHMLSEMRVFEEARELTIEKIKRGELNFE